MANTFGILTALVLAFSAFVVYKNKEEYTDQIAITENESAKRDRNKKKFAGLLRDIEGLEEEKDAANKARDEFAEMLETQEQKNDEAQREIDAVKVAIDETTKRAAEKKVKMLGVVEGFQIQELKAEIERLAISTQELEDEIAILSTQNSRLRGEKTESAERLNAIKKKLSDMTSGRSLPTMKTRISAISRTLGFVTLGGGVNSGVIGGSKLAVMRGGEKIAELNVTAVSTNTATADVVQSTLKNGEKVSVGDSVIPIEVADKK